MGQNLGDVDPDLVLIKKVSDLSNESDPALILTANSAGRLTKTNYAEIKSSVTSGVKGEATPSSSPTPWAPGDLDLYEKWDVKTAGTYTNFKDGSNQAIIVTADPDLKNNYVQIWVKNNVSQKVLSEKPNEIDTVFNPDDNVKASTMKATYESSEEFVKKALESPGSTYFKYGWDLNNTASSGTTTLVCNLAPLTEPGKIGRVIIKSIVGGNFEIYKVNAGYSPAVGNSLTRTLITTVTLTTGTNIIDVDINGIVGDMIAIKNLSGSIGYTDGGANKYFDASGATIANINSGYIAYYFETVAQGTVQYPLDNLQEIVKKDTTDFKKFLEGDASTSNHARITIEGQSNALGVGLASGLASPPFNTALFNWGLDISRVFIWNPKTDAYENIKIGVNNMASWDPFYIASGGTPTASSFGPEIGLALAWLQTHKSGNLYIDKNVGDGRPIAYFQKGGVYYTEKTARKTKADQWLKDRGITVSELGFIWIQGEGDYTQTKSYYKSQLTTLINDRIEDGFIDSKSKLIITQIPSTSGNYGTGVADAKTEYVSENKLAVLVQYTNNFNGDNIHLNTTGQINLGLKSGINIFYSDNLNYTDLETKAYWNK
jgi:hypothetical protein